MIDVAAIPVLTGHKTERERFAGAIRTWTCEGMMGDGKALQMGTSHELGQNFARAFGIQFSDADGRPAVRLADLVGGVDPADRGADHGPRRRLRAAPAPGPGPDRGGGAGGPRRARGSGGRPRPWSPTTWRRPGIRVRLDDRVDTGFGRRSIDWELKGVPVRVEVGPRDLAEGKVTLVTRHRPDQGPVPLPGRSAAVSRRPGRRWPTTCTPRRWPSAQARTVDV